MTNEADDELVWSLQRGATLQCSRDLVMEGNGEVAFTAGRMYCVESMHPIADPPFVKAIDDQGEAHRLGADDLRQFFGM